jgi:ABC-type transport system substrate-binding protein
MEVTASFITLVEAESATGIRDAFEFDKVSLVCTDPGAEDYAVFHCDYELWESENGQFVYLGCNAASKVLANAKVRAALTHAINRDLVAETYYGGFARGALLPASPQSPYYDKNLAARYGYDQEKLKTVLKEEGLEGSEIVLLVNRDDEVRTQVAQAIAGMLRECGFQVTVRREATKSFLTCLEKNKTDKNAEYDLYLGQTKLSQNMDLSAFFAEAGSLSYGGMDDPALYAMSLEALANRGNYNTLHEMIMDDGMLIPVLFRSYAVYATRGQVTALRPARDNILYYDVGRTLESAFVNEEA